MNGWKAFLANFKWFSASLSPRARTINSTQEQERIERNKEGKKEKEGQGAWFGSQKPDFCKISKNPRLEPLMNYNPTLASKSLILLRWLS